MLTAFIISMMTIRISCLRSLMECTKAGNPDIVYKFTSTSKISFPGSGIAAVAASDANLADYPQIYDCTDYRTRQAEPAPSRSFLQRYPRTDEHMKKHADIFRPKFELVLKHWIKNLADLESVHGWHRRWIFHFL